MRVSVRFHRIASVYSDVCVCSDRVCAAPALCAHSRAAAAILSCGINSSARAARRRSRARGCVLCHPPGSRTSVAGKNWTSRTAKAPWAARYGHTSVVDAAGAIYVIGGFGSGDLGSGGTYFNDVYNSTDGARPDSVGGWSVGYSRG